MNINEELDKKELKKIKLEAIRSHHKQLIEDLGISPLDFNMKMPFYDKYRRYVVGIFPSEFKREKGFFFELIDRNLNPIDNDRTVYRIPNSEGFEDEYELNEYGSYLVPVEELRVINPNSAAISKDGILNNDKILATNTKEQQATFSTKHQNITVVPKPTVYTNQPKQQPLLEDALYSEMTIRDYIAIHTGKPVSNKAWLNKLLIQDNSLPF